MAGQILRPKRIAILQSCYIPWKGYFDIIGSVDTFVVYDDVQFPQRAHWHNRNQIKTQHGMKWLSVPVDKAGGSMQLIQEMRLPLPFAEAHWRSIENAYARAPHFSTVGTFVKDLYERSTGVTHLSELNLLFLRELCGALGIATPFVNSADLSAKGRSTDRLVAICRELGATTYLTGPAAKAYLELEKFSAAGIDVEWMDYGGYPVYPQLHGEFVHTVSVIDMLFNLGDQARQFIKSSGEGGAIYGRDD